MGIKTIGMKYTKITLQEKIAFNNSLKFVLISILKSHSSLLSTTSSYILQNFLLNDKYFPSRHIKAKNIISTNKKYQFVFKAKIAAINADKKVKDKALIAKQFFSNLLIFFWIIFKNSIFE